jgi:hypothetical protein
MIERLDQATLAFQYSLLLWVGLVLLIPVAVYLYRRQQRSLGAAPRGLGLGLSLIRITILILLVLVLASPYVKLDYEIEKKPLVAVLLDQSASMDLPAGPFESDAEAASVAAAAGYQTPGGKADAETRKALDRVARAKLVQTVLNHNAAAFGKPLASRYDLRYYGFAADSTLVTLDPQRPDLLPDPPNPGGRSTYIGDAVGRILDEAGGGEIGGIVLFSDGRNTGGVPPVEVARRAAGAATPLYVVPAGASNVVRDVAVVDVFTAGLVYVGDEARVSVMVGSQGFDGKPVKVELADGETVLDTKDLVLRSAEQQTIDLVFKTSEPGGRHLTVRIPPMPEEPEYLRGNNTDSAYVRVSGEKVRVLYIDGLPRWDFRFLKNSMRRDHGLGGRLGPEPEIRLEAELRRVKTAETLLPSTLEDLARYHLIILGDASPRLLAPAYLGLLAEAVRERGVGLIVMAGPLYMPQIYGREFQELLPVAMAPGIAGFQAQADRPFHLRLSPEGAIHSVMRLYDDTDKNESVWNRMPPFHWCAAARRPAAGATVLAWCPDIEGQYGLLPLIAFQYAGQGKVLFVGTDSTWLWRQDVGERFFGKFWGQAIRFVARSDKENVKTSWLEVRPVRVQTGERVNIELLALDAAGEPRTTRRLEVQVTGVGKLRSVDLEANRAAPGHYLGQFVPEAPGDYKVGFVPGGTVAPLTATVRVTDIVEELRRPALDRATLDMLAGLSGGRVVGLADIGAIPPLLKGNPKFTPVHREATVWDNWLLLLLLALLYSADVGLRRLSGMA